MFKVVFISSSQDIYESTSINIHLTPRFQFLRVCVLKKMPFGWVREKRIEIFQSKYPVILNFSNNKLNVCFYVM